LDEQRGALASDAVALKAIEARPHQLLLEVSTLSNLAAFQSVVAELPTPPGCGGWDRCDRVTAGLTLAALVVVVGVVLGAAVWWARRK
jgi:hypothetical protein